MSGLAPPKETGLSGMFNSGLLGQMLGPAIGQMLVPLIQQAQTAFEDHEQREKLRLDQLTFISNDLTGIRQELAELVRLLKAARVRPVTELAPRPAPRKGKAKTK